MTGKALVIGATGNVGGRLVERLADLGTAVRAATRNPATVPARAGVEAIRFDYDDPGTYAAAVAGVERAFLIPKSMDPAPQETLNPLMDAAQAAGVRHIVLMTAFGVEQAEEAGMRKAERHLLASGLDYTILRPNWFMQNFSTGFIFPMIRQASAIFLPAGEGKTSLIHTDDIAAVAAAALTSDEHMGQEYGLTGGTALDYAEAAAILSRASGRAINYVPISDEAFRQSLTDAGLAPGQVDLMSSLFYPVRQGWAGAISPAVARVLGREPHSFEQFASENADLWR